MSAAAAFSVSFAAGCFGSAWQRATDVLKRRPCVREEGANEGVGPRESVVESLGEGVAVAWHRKAQRLLVRAAVDSATAAPVGLGNRDILRIV